MATPTTTTTTPMTIPKMTMVLSLRRLFQLVAGTIMRSQIEKKATSKRRLADLQSD